MIKIGTSKWEAINWVQDHLGPATPRNVAEDTLTALLREGLIETDVDEVVLLEEIDQDGLRRRARNTMISKDHRNIRRIQRTAPGCKHHAIHEGKQQQRRHHHDHMNVVQQGSTTILVELPDDEESSSYTPKRKR
ncbi:MAG: hypothetical protein EOP83_18040 [Verrucomicrobiaceae bacterium]|nr:MAG: hypothetical protein EOP83_18040 [Verrucomicrobiaceae bacterium]